MAATSALSQAYGRFRAIILTTLFLSFFINLLMFVGPLYMLQMYDRVLSSRNENTLYMITAIAVGLLVIFGILEFLRSRILVRAGMQFDEIIASPLFSRAVRLQVMHPGAGGRTALQDADKVRDFLTGQGILSFFDAPWVPIFLALCFAFHFWLGVVATAGAVIIFILAVANEFMTRDALQEATNAGSNAAHFASTTLQNAEVIRSMGMEERLANRWLSQRDQMLEGQSRASDRAGAIVACSKFVRMTLQVAILGTGAYLAMQQLISPGIMIAASIVMGRALAPVEQSVGNWKGFVAARQSGARLKRLFDAVDEDEERTELPKPKGDLRVEGVTTVLPETRETILKGITFDIKKGDTLAIVGPSGSGKSTLVRHVAGAGNPAAGAIRLDGTELKHWDPVQLGENMGYLAQDIKLFSGTVAENISRFDPDAKDEDIIAAATLAGSHEMIQGLRNGYETPVGDGGSQLSGGQRQRVGLARAVYKTPALIVLDEPNSSLDSDGEEGLIKCLNQLKKLGRTVVVVTHKANLLQLCNKTLVMADGKVQRFGPTDALYRKAAQRKAAQDAADAGGGSAPTPLTAVKSAES
ncbi:MAG: type I secretion system permease/ATPase [Pseudomonadota bacterium]